MLRLKTLFRLLRRLVVLACITAVILGNLLTKCDWF